MLITRRSVLRGLIAAPIIVSPGIIMPIRPLAPEPRKPLDMGRLGTNLSRDLVMDVHGFDMYGNRMIERIWPRKTGQKFFREITAIECVGGIVSMT